MSRVDDAAELFTNRYSCSQAVFAAFAPSLGVGSSEALKLSAGLGGGIRAGSACGAVLGALMVLGEAYADGTPGPDSRQAVADAVDTFRTRFEERVGEFDCPDILGYDTRDPEQRATVEELGLRESRCLPAVRAAAEILEEMLDAGRP